MGDLRKQLHKNKSKYFVVQSSSGCSEDHAASSTKQHSSSSSQQLKQELRDRSSALKSELFSLQERYHIDEFHFVQTYFLPPQHKESLVLVFHHGAGSSSSTFLSFISSFLEECEGERPGLFLFDMFGHGLSSDRKTKDHSLSALTDDFTFILESLVKRHRTRNLCFIGHSLGGSILSSFLSRKAKQNIYVMGLIVLDAVEETAMRSLSSLPDLLTMRPNHFASYEDAVKWHLSSKLLRNEDSAMLSVPDLLVECDRGGLTWRTDLSSMAEFWGDWFEGLSKRLLDCEGTQGNIAKLIVLGGEDHLDKDLIIGQMQGKYQLIVLNSSSNNEEVGHFIQEDLPRKLSICILEFLNRQRMNFAGGAIRSSVTPLWGGHIH